VEDSEIKWPLYCHKCGERVRVEDATFDGEWGYCEKCMRPSEENLEKKKEKLTLMDFGL